MRVCASPKGGWHAAGSIATVRGYRRGLSHDHPPAPPRTLYAGLERPRDREGRTLPVGGVIIDLEDAVAPDAKADARAQVARAVSAGGLGIAQ